MKRILLVLSVAAICMLGCTSGDSKVTSADCQEVREHTASLRLAASGLSETESAKHQKNLANSGGQEYLETCVATRSTQWIACMLKTDSLSDTASCD